MRSNIDSGDPHNTVHFAVWPSSVLRFSAIGFALASILLLYGCRSSDTPGPNTSAVAPASATVVTPAPAVNARTSLALANTAFRENRIVAPAGDNALEHALHALQLDANDAGANEILVDITPIAASAIEAAISAGNFVEAERVMNMLNSANSSSLTVQGLRRRLATATRLVVNAPPAAAAVEPAHDVVAVASAATTNGAPAPVARDDQVASIPHTTLAPTTTAPAAPTVNASVDPAAQVAAPPHEPTAAATSVASTSRSSEPVPLVKVSPDYPPAAKKRRTEGWVELQFLVGIDGIPRDIQVIRAQPPSMFDRAAVRALARWKFKPAERDGQAVEARAKTTVGFKLG